MSHIKIYEHLKLIRGFQVGHDVVEALYGSGFENLLVFSACNGIHSRYLVEVLVTKYGLSQTFRVGENGKIKLYFGLRDILHITGLPISGKPVITKEVLGDDIARDIFPGIVDVYQKTKGFSLKVLKKIATEKISGNEFKYELEFRIRATVLYILGCLVFPNSSRTHVKGIYGDFLRDVNGISRYAWGEACLVEIHNSLTESSTKITGPGESVGICGMTLAVMVSLFMFYIYFD